MSVELIQKFCERKNYNFLKVDIFSFRENGDLKNTVECAEIPNDLFGASMILRFNGNDGIFKKNFSIVQKIDTLKKLTSASIKLAECCVCYANCKEEDYKCKTCASSTCSKCRAGIKLRENCERIFLVHMEKDICEIARHINTCSFKCPICREDNI